jgi:hypothetical protein
MEVELFGSIAHFETTMHNQCPRSQLPGKVPRATAANRSQIVRCDSAESGNYTEHIKGFGCGLSKGSLPGFLLFPMSVFDEQNPLETFRRFGTPQSYFMEIFCISSMATVSLEQIVD